MANPRMPAAAVREVQGILKMWREIRSQLHQKHDDAIFGGYGSDFEARSRSGRPGNPTQSRAIRLATDPETRQLERLNAALDGAHRDIGGEQGRESPRWFAMKLLYLESPQTEEQVKALRVAKRLGISRQTLWRWQRQFQASLWERLRRQG